MRNFHTVFHRKWSESDSCLVVFNSLWPHGLYSPWNFPGQNTGVGSLSLLQGIFPTQGSNPGLPYCRQIIYQLNYQGSPFSTVVVQFTFPITVHRVLLSPNTHQHLLFCLFDNSHSNISFLWWLLMLSTFSCSCWPFYYALWKNVYSIFLPT